MTTTPTSSRRGRAVLHVAMITALALGVFLFRLGAADWRGGSDAQVGQIIQDIMDGRGWVVPLRNGRHIPDKPPLLSWLGAASAVVRGSGGDILDTRLPSAVVATAGVVAVYGFACALAGESVALWAALLLITTPQFIIGARDSRVDMVFSVTLTLAFLLGWRVYDGGGGRRTAWLAGLCFGLAVLSKGPLALVLALLVFGATVFFAPPRPGWRALLAPATLLLALGLPALWYAAATAEQGAAFLRLLLFAENVSRLTGGQGEFPLWYYVGPLIVLGLPWTLALPWVIRGESALPSRARSFLWVWVAAMFVFFSLAMGKRQAYILPLRPALAILVAGWLVPQLERWRPLRRAVRPPRSAHLFVVGLVVAALVCTMLLRAGVGGFGASDHNWGYWWRQHLHDHLGPILVLVAGLGIGCELIAWWTWQRRFDRVLYALVGTMSLVATIFISADAMVRGEALSFRAIAHSAAVDVAPNEPLAFLDVDDERAIPFLFHLRRHVPVVASVGGGGCTPPRAGSYLLAESRWDEGGCARDPHWQVLARGGPAVGKHRWQRLVLARYDGSRGS